MTDTPVMKVYKSIIEDVTDEIKDHFQEEGIDEIILQRLKALWESKLLATKAAEYEEGTLHFVPASYEPGEKQNDDNETEINIPVKPSNTLKIINDKFVPMHVTLPISSKSDSASRTLIIYVPMTALKDINLQNLLTPSVISATMGLSTLMASTLLQTHINNYFQHNNIALQSSAKQGLDGTSDDSNEEDSDISEDMKQWLDDEDKDDFENEELTKEESLNSEDDITDEEPTDLFDTDNVVVCQYYKIIRCKNKWKLCFKDGIMHLEGKDFLFRSASGDTNW